MDAQCHNCKTIFKVKGMNTLLVLSGGMTCPECKTEDGIDIIIAEA